MAFARRAIRCSSSPSLAISTRMARSAGLRKLRSAFIRRLESIPVIRSNGFRKSEDSRYTPPNSPLDRVFEIGVVEDDKCVAAAELHRRGLQVLPGSRCDALACCDAAGQRHAFDAGIVDDAIRLIMR